MGILIAVSPSSFPGLLHTERNTADLNPAAVFANADIFQWDKSLENLISIDFSIERSDESFIR